MTNPKMLLLDEPTAGVSPIVIDELLTHFRNCQNGCGNIDGRTNAKLALEIANKVTF